MYRRRIGVAAVAGTLLAARAGLQAQNVAQAELPNLIFILADDLGWGDLGCYGQRRIRTPNIDRLAREGARFTQVYAGSTVCAPSRSVLMTGQHAGHTRIRGNARYPLQPDDVTVAEVLRERGYRTALVGKWGLGEPGTTGTPNRQGFDYFFGYLNQRHAHNYYPTYLWRNEERVPLRNTVPNEDAEGSGIAEERLDYSHDLIAEEALGFVRASRDAPFFLCLALTIPHANNEAGDNGMEVPDLEGYETEDWPPAQRARAAMISRMDRDVGRVLDLLAELGIAGRTVVFFSSDNGPHEEGGSDAEFHDSNGPLRGVKRDLYEGGIRVPMLVRWPGRVPAGVVSDVIWTFADFLPTAAELAGAASPPGIDGSSVAPTLLGRPQDLSARFHYWEFHERGFQQAARWGPWKAVRRALGGPLELYHLTADAGEQYDLSGYYPEVVSRFESYLATARTDSPQWPVKGGPEEAPAAPAQAGQGTPDGGSQ